MIQSILQFASTYCTKISCNGFLGLVPVKISTVFVLPGRNEFRENHFSSFRSFASHWYLAESMLLHCHKLSSSKKNNAFDHVSLYVQHTSERPWRHWRREVTEFQCSYETLKELFQMHDSTSSRSASLVEYECMSAKGFDCGTCCHQLPSLPTVLPQITFHFRTISSQWQNLKREGSWIRQRNVKGSAFLIKNSSLFQIMGIS